MGILQRFGDIMKSNINALLDKAEDPAKMADQMLIDLRRDLADVKADTASVMAEEKATKRRLDECQENINRYLAAAKKAVASGNDGDAKELLARKQGYEANLPALQQAYDLAHGNAEKMKSMTQKLVGDIQQLEARKEAIKATNSAAKAQERMNKITSGGRDMGASTEAFDRLEDKAQQRLDAAMAASELNDGVNTGIDVLKKYESGSSASVNDELARLKAELGAGN